MRIIVMCFCAILLMLGRVAQAEISVESIHFSGTLKGYQTIERTIDLKQGDAFTIQLSSRNRFVYFNVYPPKSDEVLFTGIISGDHFQGIASQSGKYRLRTYLAKAAAIRQETADYRLIIRRN